MSRISILVVIVASIAGFAFASVSSYDFTQHLDRQVHGIHCSFVPGLEDTESGSDCEVTLMSRYSSFARTSVWGGVPISLPAMAVFAFLIFFGIDIFLTRKENDKRSTGFYLLATMLPVVSSIVMAMIALGELDAACKLCIGIYTSSGIALIAASVAWINAMRQPTVSLADMSADDADAGDSVPVSFKKPSGTSFAFLFGAFLVGCLFVLFPVLAYIMLAPDHSEFLGKCGDLKKAPDASLLVSIGEQGSVPSLEVFDPMCPACRGLEKNLNASPYGKKLARKAILFPLDAECNWMLSESLHPGACAISEAVICAGNSADSVIDWAFENQEDIHEKAKADPKVARSMVKSQFPELAKCVGSAKAKQKLNRSLRWAVDNKLSILTPQIYIGDKKMCDEDLDLGLEFALSRMVEQ